MGGWYTKFWEGGGHARLYRTFDFGAPDELLGMLGHRHVGNPGVLTLDLDLSGGGSATFELRGFRVPVTIRYTENGVDSEAEMVFGTPTTLTCPEGGTLIIHEAVAV